MNSPVTIVDYGIGNIFSVKRAFEQCGATPFLSGDPATIECADRLVLPGVGAFGDGMQGLRDRDLIEPIRRFAASGRPLLGICLGMQMLATTSAEFGAHEGLDLIKGHVVAVPDKDRDGQPLKIPHIGWADLELPEPGRWSRTIFDGTAEREAVYLVHSFQFQPDDEQARLADCFYGGNRIAAAVKSDNVIGCQFHPEKSGKVGLGLISAFLRV